MAPKHEPRDPLEVLSALLVEHNLTTIAKRLGELLSEAETSRYGYSEFLQHVLEAEQEASSGARAGRGLDPTYRSIRLTSRFGRSFRPRSSRSF
jgi:hypothetical protein